MCGTECLDAVQLAPVRREVAHITVFSYPIDHLARVKHQVDLVNDMLFVGDKD